MATEVPNGLTDGLRPVWTARIAVRMGPDRLVLLGDFPGAVDSTELLLRTLSYTHPALVRVWPKVGDARVLVMGYGGLVEEADLAIAVSTLSGDCVIPPLSDDVRDLLRSGIAALPSETRAELLAFLVDACLSGRSFLPTRLAENLHTARQALRPRLSPGLIEVNAARGLKIEITAAVDEHHFYARGWIGYGNDALKSVVAVSPEGARVDLLPTLYRYPRPDVGQFYGEEGDRVGYGFAAHFALDVPSVHGRDWVLEATPYDGTPVEANAGDLLMAVEAVRDLLVGDVAIEATEDDEFRQLHLAPAVSGVLRRARERVEIVRTEEFGAGPGTPDVSIVVPLYKRIDFVDHQLSQFVDDPELRDADLLYVLDSPELADALIAEANRLYRFYHLPFRVAVLSHNGGFSVANNLGASIARGRLLLLMNSDVMPDHAGWLSELVTFHDGIPNVGAVGPKLVYEDDSIQHAGMYFDRQPGSPLWSNEHYFKGLHRAFAQACTPRRVPAVTAACMLISKELYQQYGGLSGTYVQGDFEDSDLCIRLAAAGRDHWYAAHVELYHLEGQSYATGQRVANGKYNQWLHTYLWGDAIESLMAGYQATDEREQT